MFRSLTVYQLTMATADVLKRLDDALNTRLFSPPLDRQARAAGFVKPLGPDSEVITYQANGGVLFCLRVDEKEVPASYVKEKVAERRKKKLDAEEEFSKTDERLAKEEITEDLLPGIPPKKTLTFAYIDTQLHMLFVGATADSADEFTEELGKAFNASAPVKLLGIEAEPCDKFTDWVKDPELLGEKFTIGHQGDLKHAGTEGGCGIINAKKEDLDSDDFRSLIEAGRQVCSLSLEHEVLSLRLTSKLGIRNIVLGDDTAAETYDPDADAVTLPYQFAAFVPAMREVMTDLEPLLGGWPHQEVLDLHDQQEGGAAA